MTVMEDWRKPDKGIWEIRGEGQHFDYFIFGHRHLPIDFTLSPSSRYINTGDWITYYSFASFDGREVVLETEDKNQDFHFDLL